MINIKKHDWLSLADTSLHHMTYLHFKYKKCDWCVPDRESKFYKFLLKKDKEKEGKVIAFFKFSKDL